MVELSPQARTHSPLAFTGSMSGCEANRAGAHYTRPVRDESRFDRLQRLWNDEREAHRRRRIERLAKTSLSDRVRAGHALARLSPLDFDVAAGGLVRQWLSTPKPIDPYGLVLGPGDPVRLWWSEREEGVHGVIARIKSDRIAVVLGPEAAAELPEQVNLDLEDPVITFERGTAALSAARNLPAKHRATALVAVLEGHETPRIETRPHQEPAVRLADDALEDAQREAVVLALAATELALIHGPPGTGKTRVLVEVIGQCVARGDKVLATAASNAAVDNLAERLLARGLRVVRLGHPARVSDAVVHATLDECLQRDADVVLAREWLHRADATRRDVAKRFARPGADRRELRARLGEARTLERDARRQIRHRQEALVRAADVVLATCSGAAERLLDAVELETVAVDEATQVPDPLLLIPLLRGRRAILAGDPCQLPPTVIDPAAARAGLSETFFERLIAAHPSVSRMLEVQHRMHECIMEFPSRTMYEGRLQAAASVARHRLEDLGTAMDPLRPEVLTFIDTAGRGWDEVRDDDESVVNREQAERVTAEVRRVGARGCPWSDIAVIATYRGQVRLLRELLADEVGAGLEVSTVDAFQGREKEAVIVDLVRSNPDGELGFLADTRRMNVALTRARRYLCVVGDSATFGSHPYYGELLAAVEAGGAYLSAWVDEPAFDASK